MGEPISVTLFHNGQLYRVDLVGRRGSFLRVRVYGDVTGKPIDSWMPCAEQLLIAYSNADRTHSAEHLDALHAALHLITEQQQEYLLFMIHNL
jgi:hypothetical protein